MPSQQRNNSNSNSPEQQQQKEGGGWFVPAVLGAAVGAGLAYLLNRPESSQERQQYQRSANTTSDGRAFHADPSGCCSICREDYEATMTLQCGHILHRNCFQEMMRHSSGTPLCPTCRKRAL